METTPDDARRRRMETEFWIADEDEGQRCTHHAMRAEAAAIVSEMIAGPVRRREVCEEDGTGDGPRQQWGTARVIDGRGTRER